uniref:Bm11882 n=1 Tax=Brugia malayi TaxID=6279 RepID=A0A1I9G9X4_BRUMA|nr:Bm11882 [Brugia malayi]
MVFLHSPGCLGTQNVEQAGLRLKASAVHLPQVLGLNTICEHLQYLFALLQNSNRRYIDPSGFVKALGLDTGQQQSCALSVSALCLRRLKGVRYFVAGVRDSCESPCGCRELKLGLLPEQPVLLTANPFLQPVSYFFKLTFQCQVTSVVDYRETWSIYSVHFHGNMKAATCQLRLSASKCWELSG